MEKRKEWREISKSGSGEIEMKKKTKSGGIFMERNKRRKEKKIEWKIMTEIMEIRFRKNKERRRKKSRKNLENTEEKERANE